MLRRLRERKALAGGVREFLKRDYRELAETRIAERRIDTFEIDIRVIPAAYSRFRQFLERPQAFGGFEILPQLRHPDISLRRTRLAGT